MSLSTYADRVRRGLVDVGDTRSLSSGSRRRRWDVLMRRFPDLAEMSVVDLGGTRKHWDAAPVRPARLVLLNFQDAGGSSGGHTTTEFVLGDACDLPAALAGERFDLVYSNSVLEHVGGAYRRARFADNVHRLGDHHWIQTPYRYFPLEPHWLFPAFQFLPLRARQAVTRTWPISQRRTDDIRKALDLVLEVELLTITEMRHLFPGSQIEREHVAGLIKSLVAVR